MKFSLFYIESEWKNAVHILRDRQINHDRCITTCNESVESENVTGGVTKIIHVIIEKFKNLISGQIRHDEKHFCWCENFEKFHFFSHTSENNHFSYNLLHCMLTILTATATHHITLKLSLITRCLITFILLLKSDTLKN